MIINHYTTGYPVDLKLLCTVVWTMKKLTLQHTTVDITRIVFIGLPPMHILNISFPGGKYYVSEIEVIAYHFILGEISVINVSRYLCPI